MSMHKIGEGVEITNEEVFEALNAAQHLSGYHLEMVSALKVKGVLRFARPIVKDVQELQEQVKEQNARQGEEGPQRDKDGALLPDPSKAAVIRRQMREISEAKVAVPAEIEVLTKADFKRKERDKDGKVTEVDSVEPFILLGLGVFFDETLT